MIVYNTTFNIENDVLEECLDHLKKMYIPKAIASGFLYNPCLRRILQEETDDDQGQNFSVQFHVKNVDTLNFWLQQEGAAIQQELINRFKTKVVGFTTLMEEMDLER